jgi:DNA polymerase III subunit epsilon
MIVLDVETTGTDPRKHSIISLGAIELENPQNDFYSECKIFDGAHIDDKALEINGFTKEDITDPTKQSLEILLLAFQDWSSKCTEKTIAGHNVCFDASFLQNSYKKIGLNWTFAHRTIDTHSLAYMHMTAHGKKIPEVNDHSNITSDLLFSYVGLETIRDTHNALEDAKLTAEAISRLLYNTGLLPEFKELPVPW